MTRRRREGRRGGAGPQRGSVTAETALALPAVVVALLLVLAVAQVSAAQVACVDAARAAARRAARGEAPAAVVAAARAVGPGGTVVGVTRSGTSVTVTVSAPVRLPLPGTPSLTVRSAATADTEGGVP